MLLAPLLRLGRREEAMNLHWQGYRRVAGKRQYIDAAARHLTFLTEAGELSEAARVFGLFLPLALENTPPLYRFTFLLAGWLFLERRRAAGADDAVLKLPATFNRLRSATGYDLDALRGWFRDHTWELARSFDERDETDAHSRRVASAVAR